MRETSAAHSPASSPPAPARISTMTFLSSLGSRRTIARRISSSRRSISARAVASISRASGSSASSSNSRAPASSSTARRHSSASLAAGSSWRYVRPATAARLRSPKISGSDISRCASAKRASICSTSCSITASRVVQALRDDLHADAVVLAGVARALDGEDRLQRGDRDGELREVGLAGREELELEPGQHDSAHPALGAVAPEPLDDLERQAGDERDADDA